MKGTYDHECSFCTRRRDCVFVVQPGNPHVGSYMCAECTRGFVAVWSKVGGAAFKAAADLALALNRGRVKDDE